MQAFLGIAVLLAFCWIISENRKQIHYPSVLKALGLQLLLAILILKVPVMSAFVFKIAQFVTIIKNVTHEGTQFVYGYLGGGDTPFQWNPNSATSTFIFAFQALPIIVVFSALTMLLFHWRVLPLIVRVISFFFKKVLNIGGALGTLAAAKIFLGNIESPMVIRPYLKNFSRSELFTVMVCGMATTAMALMPIYSDILQDALSFPMQHLIAATLLNIPAAIAISQIIIPNRSAPTEAESITPHQCNNTMEAISKGTMDGMSIVPNVIGILIVTLAFVNLANVFLGLIPLPNNYVLTLEKIFGFICAPITWLMGVSWAESQIAGQLLGVKTALNELVAFSNLKNHASELSETTKVIMVYSLTSFANFSAIGIVVSSLSTMASEHRQTIISLGFKSLIAGAIASCLSGAIMGLLITYMQ